MKKNRDHAEMEKRRLKSAKLFDNGKSAPEVARRLGVARQVAYRWKSLWSNGGTQALASKGNAGRKPKLTRQQFADVTEALLEGPEQQGYKTNLWTLPRVAVLIKESDWCELPSWACLEVARSCRVQLPAPGAPGA